MVFVSEVALVLIKTRVSQMISSIQTNTSQNVQHLVHDFDSFMTLFDSLASQAFPSSCDDKTCVYEKVFMAQIFTAVGLKERPIELLREVLLMLNRYLVGTRMIAHRLKRAIQHTDGNDEHDIGDLDGLPGPALWCILNKITEA